jgi:MftR C-terminal domain
VVIQDDMDARLFASFARQPAELGTVAALRASLREVAASFTPEEMEQLREAFALQVTVPEIRARILDDANRMMHLMTEALAKRTGRAADDLAVRTFAGVVFGVMTSASLPYHQMPEGGLDSGHVADMFERIDEALALLEAGLPL